MVNVPFDAIGSEGYFPTDEVPTPGGMRTRSQHRAPANGAPSGYGAFTGYNLRVPDPSVGGQARQAPAIGWDTGLAPWRERRQRFTGATMVLSPLGANPKTGHVGFTTRSQRLHNGVMSQLTDYTPTPEDVSSAWLNYGA